MTGPWLGLYLPEDFYSAPHRAHEYHSSWDKRILVLSFYIAWGTGKEGPDLAGIHRVIESGFLPMITWEPWQPQQWPAGERPAEQPEFSLSSILNGRYEDYIRIWARELKKVKSSIFFRPMHEMNGNWYPWCEKVNGNKPGEYAETWRYIRSIFREAQNDGLVWVWSPYAQSVPDEPDNEMGQFYPGDQEVDWMGLDGYNWGKSREWSGWRNFGDIFENGYDRLMQLAPDKSCMIAEVGCAEAGGSKGSWIEAAFEVLTKRFLNVKGLVWFNIDKECDWRIESSQESETSFKKSRCRY